MLRSYHIRDFRRLIQIPYLHDIAVYTRRVLKSIEYPLGRGHQHSQALVMFGLGHKILFDVFYIRAVIRYYKHFTGAG